MQDVRVGRIKFRYGCGTTLKKTLHKRQREILDDDHNLVFFFVNVPI